MEQPTIQEPGYAAPTPKPWQPNEGLFGLGVGGWKNPFVNATITQETINNKPGYYRRYTKLDGTQGIEEVTDQKEIGKSILGGEIGKPAKDAAEAKAEAQKQRTEQEVRDSAARERQLRNRQLGLTERGVDNAFSLGKGELSLKDRGLSNDLTLGTGEIGVRSQANQVTDRGNLLNAGVQLANVDVNRISALSGVLDTQQDNLRADKSLEHEMAMQRYGIYDAAMNRHLSALQAERAEKVAAFQRIGNRLSMAFGGRPI